jgi:CheY-like chemotaxis protein
MALILIVENDIPNMALASIVLAKAGHAVIQAEDAKSGIEKTHSELPDLILMDIQLPGMSGLEAVVQLKASAVTKSIPIIAVTAQAMNGDEARCRELGCDDYLAKPISYKSLWAAIKIQLQNPSAKLTSS